MAASKPTFPLSVAGDALQFILSRHLEALTLVRVRPLSELKFTPQPLTPVVYEDDDFGVCKSAKEFLPQSTQTVSLHRRHSRTRLSYGTLRREPAVSGFDSPFTPNPRSWERIARQVLPDTWVHRVPAGDSCSLVSLSCGSPIKRQGITLPLEDHCYPLPSPVLNTVGTALDIPAVGTIQLRYTPFRACRNLCFY